MAARPAPRYAKDPVALAKLRREKAFSTPIDLAAAAKKQMGVTVENDRVTDFGKPTQDEGIVSQMLRRYTINIPKGAYAVGRDTLSGGESAYKPAPAWMKLLYGPGVQTDMLYNMATNEKFNDALAPTDVVGGGVGGLVKGALKVATSKGGKAAIAGLIAGEASGLRDTDTAQAASPVVIAKPGLRFLSEIFSGQAGGARSIVPQTLQGAREVLRTSFDSATERATEVGKGLETTLMDKENAASASLAEHTIGGRTLSDIMADAGLPDRFRTAADTALDTAKKGVTVADTARNTDIMEQLTTAGSMVRDVRAPDSVGGFYLPRGGNIFENDHGAAVSGVTQIIKEQAETIIKGGGQLDQAWYDESQKLLDLVNSVDNIQRVPRVWNQLKRNYSPDVAKKLLKKQFPGLERHMGSTDYFDYLFDQWAGVVRAKPFGLDEKGIKEAYGRAPAWFERLSK